jgi:hypothetical protein
LVHLTTSASLSELGSNQSDEFGGRRDSEVNMTNGVRHAGNVGVIKPSSEKVLFFGEERAGPDASGAHATDRSSLFWMRGEEVPHDIIRRDA